MGVYIPRLAWTSATATTTSAASAPSVPSSTGCEQVGALCINSIYFIDCIDCMTTAAAVICF